VLNAVARRIIDDPVTPFHTNTRAARLRPQVRSAKSFFLENHLYFDPPTAIFTACALVADTSRTRSNTAECA
jgi:hypothetical protein